MNLWCGWFAGTAVKKICSRRASGDCRCCGTLIALAVRSAFSAKLKSDGLLGVAALAKATSPPLSRWKKWCSAWNRPSLLGGQRACWMLGSRFDGQQTEDRR